ncbi:hypothetical protein H8K32_05280 [Undibacterium jejuense]|uniref:Uncharacterized protein n=1 Tax=Undibacterium jejuense TaxID=1344949 RepID=A0A923HGX8_9BURK|nr:hypothetical protein [Undibacterium jejuense]MBC3860509.1 hypothetical protein [Undibacterium jejuense]MBC3861506.1 hypothetical protein [Undibacterium jejuense]
MDKSNHLKNLFADSSLWVSANIIGIFVYLNAREYSWPTATDEGLIATGNDAIFFGLTELPVLALFFVVNTTWLLRIFMRRNMPMFLVWIVIAIAWATPLAIEFHARTHAVAV